MISVIVLTYNHEATIARTLESILRQKCSEPIEIIIGEDCSTDTTLAICRDYQQRYPDVIRLFANEHNKGVVDNYYDCMLEARGEYLADCAGDDEWCDEYKLQKQLQILQQYPSVVLVHSDYRIRNAQTGDITTPPAARVSSGITHSQEMVRTIMQFTGQRIAVVLCTAMWRKDVFMKVYQEHHDFFRGNGMMFEDLQLQALMAGEGDMYYMPEVMLIYDDNPTGISNNSNYRRRMHFAIQTVTMLHRLARHYGIGIRAMIPTYLHHIRPIITFGIRSIFCR